MLTLTIFFPFHGTRQKCKGGRVTEFPTICTIESTKLSQIDNNCNREYYFSSASKITDIGIPLITHSSILQFQIV